MILSACTISIKPNSFSFAGAVCRRVGILEPVDGGVDRACRGSSAGDNNPILGFHKMEFVYWMVLSCAFMCFH